MSGLWWALVALGATGCGLSCTLMYAPSTLTVQIVGGTQPEGLYEIELSGFNQHAMCVFDLPYVEGDIVSCTDNATVAFAPDGSAVAGLSIIGVNAETLAARVLLDGEEIAQEVLSSPPSSSRCRRIPAPREVW